MDTMVRGGYSPKKFRPFCNFIDVSKVQGKESSQKEDYYAFLGRIDDYKGILTLCKAANQLSYKLKVIGGGPLLNVLRETYKDHPHLEFLGQRTWEELAPILAHAKFMVLPSECSENNPLTVIEAQSLGTPVLGARIGGIPELIKNLTPTPSPQGEGSVRNGEDMVPNGMTFESGNVEDLKKKIQAMWDASWDYEAIAQQAQERYSSEAYYEQLMKYYQG
jgi:glycosyltransferase involved in cell wall biosynthesis